MGLPPNTTKPLPPPDAPAASANPFQGPSTGPRPRSVREEVAVHATATPNAKTGDAVVNDAWMFDDSTYEHDPSRDDLLQRAAQLGSARLTWENIALAPTDPILGEKLKPRVAERRARLRKVVKAALGGCLAFCFVALAATALSSGPSEPSVVKAARKTAPAIGVVPIEKLDLTPRPKATSHVSAAARYASAPLKKRR